jgi:hypothetical protein
MSNVTEVTFEQARRGDLISGTSDLYNGGKRFTGVITRIRGSRVFFTTKNGRSRQCLDIADWTSYEIRHYGRA